MQKVPLIKRTIIIYYFYEGLFLSSGVYDCWGNPIFLLFGGSYEKKSPMFRLRTVDVHDGNCANVRG